MMDIITNDIEGYQGVDRAEQPRAWEIHSDLWYAPIPERRTATASWQRSALIITALSTLAWAVVVLVVIEVLAHL